MLRDRPGQPGLSHWRDTSLGRPAPPQGCSANLEAVRRAGCASHRLAKRPCRRDAHFFLQLSIPGAPVEEALDLPHRRRAAITGALLGLLAGSVALMGVLAVAAGCLPYRISSPAHPWPPLCSDPAYRVITYLSFPVNLLSNDLSTAMLLAPLSLLMYAILGALIGSALEASRTSSPRQ